MNANEIQPLEIIKVLLSTEEYVIEPTFARVMKNDVKNRNLFVLFLNDNGKLDRQVSEISYDSILEHWKDETNIWDVAGVEPVSDEESDSEDETLGGFIVPDDEKDNPAFTDEHRKFQKSWDDWVPDTPQGQNYKDIVDRVERKYC